MCNRNVKLAALIAGASAGAFLLWACAGSQPQQTEIPLSAVLDCTGAYEVTAIFPAIPQPNPVVDAGLVLQELGATPGAFALAGPDSGPAFSEPRVRHRAAVVCACRARRNRGRSDTASTWASILAVTGGLGTVGGGTLNGISATGVDDTTRKTVLTSGIIAMGVGALAFGAGTALALTKTSSSFASAASDQEYAAAVLWNDAAPQVDWDRAWSACVTSEGSDKPLFPDNPASSFSFDAGIAIEASTSVSAETGAGSNHVNGLIGSVPTAKVDAGRD
jgi:hypothetical protein